MGKPSRERSIYLSDIPLDKAWAAWRKSLEAAGCWAPLGREEIELREALGRITAEPVFARISSPHYHAAAMDGYALRAMSTEHATDRAPVTLKLGAKAEYVDTGDPLPTWADAVIPIEEVEPVGEARASRSPEAIRIFKSVPPWSHVRSVGEDMVTTEMVLPAGHCLRPVDLGAIAGCGYRTVTVWRKPRVAILPTGTELVAPGEPVRAGDVVEFNSMILAAQVETWGGEGVIFQNVADDRVEIENRVRSAADEVDLMLVIAGSSAGSEDYSAAVIEALGEVLVHGIAVRPGHPVILGMLTVEADDRSQIPVVGVPGYPVSATLTGEIFVEPLLAQWTGRRPYKAALVTAKMTKKVHSSLGDLEYLRVALGIVGEDMIAAPLSRGAGVISSLVRADGIVKIPAGIQGIHAGDLVDVHLYRPMEEIERSLLVIGSHDLTIDLIAQRLAIDGIRISSANLGSIGGLIALSRREAHIAGSHLLDSETGEYNLSFIRNYLPETPVHVIGFVLREQGLIVAPGNPKDITSLEDLTREEVSFVNRQRGAGTRILLDHHLELLGIDSEQIRGYEHEEFTHLNVAAAVASERSDCGLGIRAAAPALGMDFVPLFEERYDLVIPVEHVGNPMVKSLLALLHDDSFRSAVGALPGYRIDPMGDQIAILP
jgi:putative molybdopterin biosynthesis protein